MQWNDYNIIHTKIQYSLGTVVVVDEGTVANVCMFLKKKHC
jgi:hypothetical protein